MHTIYIRIFSTKQLFYDTKCFQKCGQSAVIIHIIPYTNNTNLVSLVNGSFEVTNLNGLNRYSSNSEHDKRKTNSTVCLHLLTYPYELQN